MREVNFSQNLKSVVWKMTLPRPWPFQTSQGRGRLIFWVTPSKFGVKTHLLKMYKWCVIMILIPQAVSDLKKSGWAAPYISIACTCIMSYIREIHIFYFCRDNNIFFPMNWTFHLSCDRIQTNDCIFNPIQRAPPLGVEYGIQLKRVTSPFRSPDVGPSFDILSITTPEIPLPVSTPINCGAKEVVAQVYFLIFI